MWPIIFASTIAGSATQLILEQNAAAVHILFRIPSLRVWCCGGKGNVGKRKKITVWLEIERVYRSSFKWNEMYQVITYLYLTSSRAVPVSDSSACWSILTIERSPYELMDAEIGDESDTISFSSGKVTTLLLCNIINLELWAHHNHSLSYCVTLRSSIYLAYRSCQDSFRSC